jgi:hypothetical protein
VRSVTKDIIRLDSRREDNWQLRSWENAAILRALAERLGHRPLSSYLYSYRDHTDVRALGADAFGPTANGGYPTCHDDCRACAR